MADGIFVSATSHSRIVCYSLLLVPISPDAPHENHYDSDGGGDGKHDVGILPSLDDALNYLFWLSW